MKSIKSSSISNPTELKQLQKLFVRIFKEWAILLILEKKLHSFYSFIYSECFSKVPLLKEASAVTFFPILE